jgi:hypothetical protein
MTMAAPLPTGGWGAVYDAGFRGPGLPPDSWLPASKADLARDPELYPYNDMQKRFRSVEENLNAHIKQKWTILKRVDGVHRSKLELYTIVVGGRR